MPGCKDPFIVLFMRWRVAENAAFAAERRLRRAGGCGGPVQPFVARQMRAVANANYDLLLRQVREARARLPLI